MSKLSTFLSTFLSPNSLDYSALHKTIISLLASVVEIDKLMQSVLSALLRSLSINNGAIVVLKGGVIGRIEFLGYPGQVPFSGTELNWLLSQSTSLIQLKDLKESVEKDFFIAKNLSLIVTLGPKEERIGYLLLGKKNNNLTYSHHDIALLTDLAPQMTIALKNAESRREIQEFNFTLAGKVAERTRQLEEAQAKELRLKDEFVFIATHDLATPVTAISGFTALINARNEPVSDTLKQNLHAITEASDRLKVLVNDLLEVARSDAGTIKVKVVKTDLTPLIKSALVLATPQATAKQVELKTELSDNCFVQGDASKLSEIIENLLSNGIKYNKPGGSVTVTTTINDTTCELIVKDTGLGIPTTEHTKVFTKFFRSDDPVVRTLPGTGLGLFVVRMLTEKMGGTISFSSTRGIGTTFTLRFSRAT